MLITRPLLTSKIASRFYLRWLNADPARPALAASLAGLSLTQDDFARLLQNEIIAGLPLPRAMRRVRNAVVANIISRDLGGQADLAEVVGTISAFADYAIRTVLAALHAEMVASHGEPIGEESGQPQEIIVLGMGKLGGGELNVSSDIDLIFVYPEDGETRLANPAGDGQQRQLSNHEFFVRLGKKLIADLSAIIEDGMVFRVDMALRPNGNSGPLAACFGMVEEYLIAQGREWERYAWVKARAITGTADDIAALEKIIQPFVYRRYLDYGSIDAMRNMHAQIRAEVLRQEVRHPERSYNVKLGRGGIREVEFLAQVFQLIRGGRDPALRDRSTRTTLSTLAEKNLLTPDVVEKLLESYTFLRNLEHRLQYLDDAQTHTLPASDADRQVIAQMMGFAKADELLQSLESHRGFVASQFDAIFRSGQSSEDSEQTPPPPAVLCENETPEALEASLAAIGFSEPRTSARRLLATLSAPRLQALSPNSRHQLLALMNAALPIVAGIAADHAATLNRLLDFFEAIARRAAYLALLTEYPSALGRVIRMMSASDWAAKYLTRHPLLLDELLEDKLLQAAPDWVAFEHECRQQLDAVPGDTERQMDVLRELHHAQLLRLLVQDLEGQLSVERLADHLSALADVLVGVTLHAIWQSLPNRHREVPKFAVIAYGKLGGKELGYASDLDLIFLYDDDHPDAPMLYAKLAQRFITWMTSHTPAGILFDIDIALRPDGASGLMVSPFSSFEKYQINSAWLWEHQALTRARFCSGDAEIGARFEALRETVLRQPCDDAKLKQEVLGMRQKMRDAHPNRSGLFDLKHDAGGMIDIEFLVQYLVLKHAPQYPALTGDIGNIALLILCGNLGLIDSSLAAEVANAYRLFRKLQHQIRMQGADRARVEHARVAMHVDKVVELYGQVFGTR